LHRGSAFPDAAGGWCRGVARAGRGLGAGNEVYSRHGHLHLRGWLAAHAAWRVAYAALASRPMRAIGRVSYGLYVYHPAIIGLVAAHLAGSGLWLRGVVFAALSYGAAVVSFYGVEKRLTDLKQRLAPEPAFESVK